MSADEPVPPISISGGAGGHAALTEDLRHASWTLEHAAGEVEEAAHQLRMATFWLERALPDALPGVAGALSHVHHEVEGAMQGPGGAVALQGDLADAAARVAAVARAYDDAESQAQVGMGSAQWWGDLGAFLFKAATLPVRTQTGVMLRFTGEAAQAMADGAELMAGAQDSRLPYLGAPWRAGAHAWGQAADNADRASDYLLPSFDLPSFDLSITDILNGATVGAALGALDFSLGPLPSSYELTAGTLGVLVSLLERLAGEPLYSGVVPRIGSHREVDVPQDVHDLIAGLHGIDPGGPGAIVIDTVEHPDGTRSHIVRIPGTRDSWIKDPSPLDYGSNLPAVLGNDSDTEQMVRDALAAAGIDPSESIMLVGHSQGGIVATNISAALGEDYNVTHVVTAGSPTDRPGYTPHVQYLNILHPSDLVPGVDGVGPTDLPHVTTVTGHLDQAADPGLRVANEGIGTAHHITTYMATARAAADSQHPSMTAWRASAQEFLSGGRATRREYAPTFIEANPPRSPQTDATGTSAGAGNRDAGEATARCERASGPGRRPWPGELTARCQPPVPNPPRVPALPSVPGPLDELLSPTLGTVVPVPTG